MKAEQENKLDFEAPFESEDDVNYLYLVNKMD